MIALRNSILVLLLQLTLCVGLFGQFAITPATNSCSCNGAFTYTNTTAGNATYTLTGSNGTIVNQVTNASVSFTVSGLCSQIFALSIQQNGSTSTLAVNIPVVGFNPGNAQNHQICSTSGNNNLNNVIPALAAGGTWTRPNGTTFNGIVNGGGDVSGLYVYTIMQNGCAVSTGVWLTVIQNANPGQTTTYLICENYAPFQMLTFMAGSPDPGGQWFAAGGVPMNGIFNPATMNSGLFTYMIDNIPGCNPVFATMFVMENQLPNAGTDATVLVCAGGTPFNMTDYLGGNPQTNGVWYNEFNQIVSSTFNPSTQPAGTYRYYIDALTPCADQNSYLTINFTNSNPSGASASVQVCQNAPSFNMTSALAGNPLPGGTWVNSSGQVVGATFNPATQPSGVFSYSFQSVGCTPNNAQLSVMVSALPNAGLDNSIVLCETISSFNLNTLLSPGAGSGGVWQNAQGSTIVPLINLGSGNQTSTYSYTVSSTSCPSDVAQFQVQTVSPPAALSAQSIELCSNSAVFDLSGLYSGISGVIFQNASGVPIGASINPGSDASQMITAVLPSGNVCPNSTAPVDLVIEQPAFQNTSANLDVCLGSQATIDLTGIVAGIDYSSGVWQDAAGNVVDHLFSPSNAGQFNFQFTSTGIACGSSILDIAVQVFQPNTVGPNATVLLCADSQSQTLDALSGNISTNGQWYYSGIAVTGTLFQPSVSPAGIYTFMAPANGPCPAASSTLQINVQQGLQFDAGPDVSICNDISQVQIGQSNLGNFSYIWQPAQFLNSAAVATPTFTHPQSTNNFTQYEYTVTATDGICSATDTVHITVYPLPTINLYDSYELCFGETWGVQLPLGNSYLWTPSSIFSNPTSNAQQLTPTGNISFEVTTTNNWGCQSITASEIVVNPLPVIVVNDSLIQSCPPLVHTFHLEPESEHIGQINWIIPSIAGGTGNSFETQLTNTGLYDLQIQAMSSAGCVSTLFLNDLMEVFPKPVATFQTDPVRISTIDPMARFINGSAGAISYEWTFDDVGTSDETQPIFEFPSDKPRNFLICLEATNEFGCSDTTCKYLVLENEYILFAPNAFTPDDDGINDIFRPIIRGFDESTYSLRIFNRWGALIFETRDVNEPWIGNVNKGDYYAQPDIYIWHIEVKDLEIADYQVFEGYITLIR